MKREIEIKCLLDGEAGKKALLKKVSKLFPEHEKLQTKTVLSYFYKDGATKEQILSAGSKLLDKDDMINLEHLLESSDGTIVKARSIDEKNYFCVKGSAKGDDPVHAVNRIELEAIIAMPLEEIGSIIESSGIEIASKWSSRREFYKLTPEIELNIEFVGGYGYKAEIEIVIDDTDSHDAAIQQISDIASQLGLKEASQALFGRMYKYYNEHWNEYFNSDKAFPPEVWQKLGRDLK